MASSNAGGNPQGVDVSSHVIRPLLLCLRFTSTNALSSSVICSSGSDSSSLSFTTHSFCEGAVLLRCLTSCFFYFPYLKWFHYHKKEIISKCLLFLQSSSCYANDIYIMQVFVRYIHCNNHTHVYTSSICYVT